MAGERRAGCQAELVDHGRRQVAQAYRIGDDICGTPGQENNKWDGDLVEIETATMAKDAVHSKRLPVIRGNDDQRLVKQALAFQRFEQPSKLIVEDTRCSRRNSRGPSQRRAAEIAVFKCEKSVKS